MRASASLVGIVAILIGVPLLLWRLGMPLLPARVPSLHEAVAVFLRPDNGSLLMGTLLVIGVLVWAQLSVSILAELVAALRHRPGLRVELPGLRASRLLASVLVAGVLGAGGAGPALAAEPIAAVVAYRPSGRRPCDCRPAVAGPSPTRRELPRYVVQERDSLWRIAEARLGDPLRWREIYDLNHAVVQPDGGRLTDATLLHPGWTLRLPADAATTDVTAIVQPGDTLGKIAGARLHDSRRAGEIFALNVGRPQPNGLRLTNPDRIQPGWRLTLPATPSPSVHPHPAPPSTDAAPTPTVPTVPGNPSIDPKPTTTPGDLRPDTNRPNSPASTAPEPTTTAPTPPPVTATPPSAVATPNAGRAPGGVPVGSVAEWGVSAAGGFRSGRRAHSGQAPPATPPRLPAPAAGARRPGRAPRMAGGHRAVGGGHRDAGFGLAWAGTAGLVAPDRARPDPGRARPRPGSPAPGRPDQLRPDRRGPITAAAPFVPGEDAVDVAATQGCRASPRPGRGRPLLRPLPLAGVGRGPRRPAVAAGSGAPRLRHRDRETRHRGRVVAPHRRRVGQRPLERGRRDPPGRIRPELPPLNTDRLRVLPDLAAALTELRVARRRIAATCAATGAGVVEGRLSGTAPDGWLPVLLLVADLTDTDDQARADLHALADEPLERGFAVLAHDTDVIGTDIHITDDDTLVTQGAEPGAWRVETMTAATAGGLADILAPTTARRPSRRSRRASRAVGGRHGRRRRPHPSPTTPPQTTTLPTTPSASFGDDASRPATV